MSKKRIIYVYDCSNEKSFHLVKIGVSESLSKKRMDQHKRTSYHGFQCQTDSNKDPIYFAIKTKTDAEKILNNIIYECLSRNRLGKIEVFNIEYKLIKELLKYFGDVVHDDESSVGKNKKDTIVKSHNPNNRSSFTKYNVKPNDTLIFIGTKKVPGGKKVIAFDNTNKIKDSNGKIFSISSYATKILNTQSANGFSYFRKENSKMSLIEEYSNKNNII
ncbi:MAG: GIY-YIG nuclease family protein [Mycoplasmataceae bacterium]|jgi:hypothetical protein|nr:GIY-YIG nuclease family protein [Mycoplasmataceae bacterium]